MMQAAVLPACGSVWPSVRMMMRRGMGRQRGTGDGEQGQRGHVLERVLSTQYRRSMQAGIRPGSDVLWHSCSSPSSPVPRPLSPSSVPRPQPEHLIEREQNLEDDQDDDVVFDAQRATGLDQAEGSLDRAGDELQLAIEGSESLENFKFVAQAGEQALQIRPVPEELRRVVDLHPPDHLLLD